MERRKSRSVNIGGLKIGSGCDIAIQSMTNTDTRDVDATVAQINMLADCGCEIIRVAVPDMAAAEALPDIKKRISIPLVADIHFDYRLALRSLENGVDKLRLNPGNIGDSDKVRQVAAAAKSRGVPIRIGVNSGSLEKDILEKYNGVTAQGLVESALRHVALLEDADFTDIIISLKSSSVPLSIAAYTLIAEKVDYPLHLGITEAGTVYSGSIKSAVGMGTLLNNGIGDTIRVSLTCEPDKRAEEIKCAKEILAALGIRKFGADFISCPTCGRTQIDLVKIAQAVEQSCVGINKNIKVAVMGCVVNGPGEAKEADIGLAGGKEFGIIFKKGVIVKRVPESELLGEFLKELETL